jgi:hypothetical protein
MLTGRMNAPSFNCRVAIAQSSLLLPRQKIGRPAVKAIAGEREEYCDFGRCRGRTLRRMLSANTAFVMPGLVPGIHVFKRIMA